MVKSSKLQPGLGPIVVSWALLISALALTTGCESFKGKEAAKKTEAVATEGKEGEEKLTGPCGEYAKQLCELFGNPSTGCSAVERAAEIMAPAACSAGLGDMEYSKRKVAELRKTCKDLEDKLCADIGTKTQTCDMVREQTPKMAPERCAMMMKRYDQILADLKKQEEANKPLSADKQAAIAAPSAPSFGPSEAKVTLVEFSDFECPFCSKAAKVTGQIKEKYGDKVRFVFRQFPLSFHKNSHLAAQAALAANAQGKFWEFHDLLFANQKELDRPSLDKYGKDVGLDMKAFKKALDDKTFKERVDADVKLGGEVAVRGTPTLFVNGERVRNPADLDVVSKSIDRALGGQGS